MAKIIFNDFSIEVKESIDELRKKHVTKDFIEVTECVYSHTDITDIKILINVNHIILIRE